MLYDVAPLGQKTDFLPLAGQLWGRDDSMKNEYTVVIKKEGNWWIGWIEEVPGVNCQEKTYKELTETLEVTLKEALDL